MFPLHIRLTFNNTIKVPHITRNLKKYKAYRQELNMTLLRNLYYLLSRLQLVY